MIGDDGWIKNVFIPTVQKRGAAVIEARGASSAASAANAAINHVQTWYHGTPQGDWASMGIPSTGDYGTPEGVIFSYPVTVQNGDFSIVQGLDLSEFDRQMIAGTATNFLKNVPLLKICSASQQIRRAVSGRLLPGKDRRS